MIPGTMPDPDSAWRRRASTWTAYKRRVVRAQAKQVSNAISGIVMVMAWTVETLNDTVDAELDALTPDMRARFVRIARLIEAVGLSNVREPHVKHVRGPLWEIRLQGKAGIA